MVVVVVVFVRDVVDTNVVPNELPSGSSKNLNFQKRSQEKIPERERSEIMTCWSNQKRFQL
jgi:hypothetical protein